MKHILNRVFVLLSLFWGADLLAGDYSNWEPTTSNRQIEFCSKHNSDGSYNFQYRNVSSSSTYEVVVRNMKNERELDVVLKPGKAAPVHTYTDRLFVDTILK